MSNFWSLWITVITFIVIFGSLWLLIANRKTEIKGDLEEGEIPKTGHVYDGIEEYENPLPVWWFWMFIGSAVFALVYLLLYPGLGNYKGLLGWTQEKQWEQRVAAANQTLDKQYSIYAATDITELVADPSALRMGRRLFNNNCSVCHGIGGVGANGFPNLSDSEWQYGGTPEAILHSVTHGRQAAMPAWGSILGEQGIVDVTDYILSLGGKDFDPQSAARGATHYQTLCVACHGVDGVGMQALGAPNLADNVWLYNQADTSLVDNIRHSIRNGRNGNMPSHGDKLRPEKIHLISAYVYSLSQTNQ
ncbi:MAG: cytochrome-c oxidase, cbb3-type subunit III [Porticoccaceae bacterium]|nr:cytochrome-c oxidase, cbb3-type subunit III [Porticoccaceae bacterium]